VTPGADEGYAAAVAADLDQPLATGRVGAGRGATVGKWRGREYAVAGGIGVATGRCDDANVAVLAVVNAVGDVVGSDGAVIAGSSAPPDAPAFPVAAPFEEEGANTTLVVVVTDAAIDKLECHLVAQSAHDGLARSLRPAHTRFDGDLAIALATGLVDTQLDRLRMVATELVAEAIRRAPG
jgi:L-aminopeptidase/D-esterase-like protein